MNVTLRGIRISSPDRLVFPELGLSKLDLARYYDHVAPRMLPHVQGRPLTLFWCPNGVDGTCRYMRHSKVWGPSALRRVNIREKTKVGEYLVADTEAAIVALAQLGIVEIHTWNSTTEALEHPDRVIWDLDPGPDVTWPRVVEAAKMLRAALDVLGLDSWVKTTGGNGLHVVVPIRPSRDWSECLAFARGVAQALERSAPDAFTTAFGKRGRERKILIDYLRNNRTNTSVAAFSARARAGATVSMPIAWSDLTSKQPVFSVPSMQRALRRADSWRDYWTTKQRISRRAFAAVTRFR